MVANSPLDFDIEPETSIWDSVAFSLDNPPPPPPAEVDNAARMAAMANIDPEPTDLFNRYRETTNTYRNIINNEGSDASIRDDASRRLKAAHLQGLADAFRDAPSIDPSGALAENIVRAGRMKQAEDDLAAREYALEQQTIQNIQNLASRGNRTQAEILLNNLERGGPEQIMRDNATKQLILQREINAAVTAEEDRGPIRWTVDLLLGILPLNSSISQIGNVEVGKAEKDMFDWFMSGRRRTAERASLWNLPPDQFAQAVRDQVLPNVMEHSTLLGYTSQSERSELLRSMMSSPDVFLNNTFNLVDNVGLLPFTKIAKGATSIPALLVRQGARKEASQILASTIRDMSANGINEATQAAGVSIDDVTRNVLPSVVNAEGPDTLVSVAGDTLMQLERGDRLLQELTPFIRDGRFTGDELSEAVRTTSARIETELDRPLKDVQRVAVPLSDGTELSRVQFVVGNKRGGGFASEKAANRQAATMGLPESNVFREGATTERVTGFQTAKGSRYTVDETGRTTRDKAYRQEHGESEQGPQPQSERTVYLDEQSARALAPPQGGWRLFLSDNGRASIITRNADGKWGRSPSATDIPVSTTPQEGMIPLEVWENAGRNSSSGGGSVFNRIHFGNKITSITKENAPSPVFKDESGQWFIRSVVDMPETGVFTRELSPSVTNMASRYLLSTRRTGDSLLEDAARVAGNVEQRTVKTLIDPMLRTFKQLNNAQRGQLGQLVTAGENAGRWFDESELRTLYNRTFNRDPTVREINAYNTIRDFNDIEFTVRNDNVWRPLFMRGYRTVSFDIPGGARVERANGLVGSAPAGRVFDLQNNTLFTRGRNPLTAERLARYKEDGFVVVNLDRAVTAPDGSTVRSFIMKRNNLLEENLRRDQLAYRAGGHRMYKEKYFAKQTRVGRQPDGSEYLENPGTFVVGTKQEVDAWTNVMEQARLAYIDEPANLSRLDEILTGHPGVPDAETFVARMSDGTYSSKHSFGTYFDRTNPAEYTNIDPDAAMFNVDELDSMTDFYRTDGRMYYSKKGESLHDVRGDQAPTLDPFETINRSMHHVSRVMSWNDYRAQAIDRWVKTYAPHFQQGSFSPNSPAASIFRTAKINPAVPVKLKHQAESVRSTIQRNLGWRTDVDVERFEEMRRFSEWVGDNVNPKAGKAVLGMFTDNNPIQQLRRLAYDSKLGMFNPAQFPLQLSTTVAAITLSPRHGFEGLVLAPFMRMFLHNGSESTLDWIGKNMAKKAGLSEADLKESFRMGRNSGFFDINPSHGMVNADSFQGIGGDIANTVETARNKGMFFFNEGERVNRMVAWHIAFRETKLAGEATGADFIRRVAGRAEDYSMSMSRESRARFQEGLASIPTQFWAYNARMIEAVFGNQFTPMQRLRLFVGQAALYGTAGVPLATGISNLIREREPGDVSQENGPHWTRGLVDQMIYAATGLDIQAGQRLGTGDWIVDTVSDLFGMSSYQNKTPVEIIGGATTSILWDTIKPLKQVAEWQLSEIAGVEGKPPPPDAYLRMFKNISTVGNISKAWNLWNYGTYVTNTGSTSVAGLPPQTAIAAILGIAPGELNDMEVMNGYHKKKSEFIAEASRVIQNYRTRGLNEPENAEQLREELQAYITTLPPDIRQKALKRAHKDTPRSVYEIYVERFNRENNDGG